MLEHDTVCAVFFSALISREKCLINLIFIVRYFSTHFFVSSSHLIFAFILCRDKWKYTPLREALEYWIEMSWDESSVCAFKFVFRHSFARSWIVVSIYRNRLKFFLLFYFVLFFSALFLTLPTFCFNLNFFFLSKTCCVTSRGDHE
jgi:hypothetical protein